MNKYLIGLILVSIVGVGFLYYSNRSETLEETKSSVNSKLTKVQSNKSSKKSSAEINKLQQKIATLEARIDQIGTLAKASNPHSDKKIESSSAARPTKEAIEQKERVYFEGVGSKFRHQPVDSSWSNEVTGRIESAASSVAEKGVTIDHIECRSTMCRLELPEYGPEVIETLKTDFRPQISGLFRGGVARVDEEVGKLIIYLATNTSDFRQN